MTPAERMATARRALERAEAAAGLRTRLAAPLRLAADDDDAAAADDAAGPARRAVPQDVGRVPDGTGRRPGVAVPETEGGSPSRAGRVRDAADREPDAAGREPGAAGPGPGVAVPGAAGLGPGVAAPDAARVVTTGPVGGTVADHLPVPAALAGFFPSAGLRRGSVVQVGGSSSLLLALLAAAQGEGWVALAALPDVGLQAAAEAGLSLERSMVVPRTGPEAAAVVGALVDGVDVLAVGDCRALGARDRRLLSARLRSRGAVLLSTAHWPGADVVLRAGEARTEGLGRGWGRVAGGEMTVHGRGRSGVAGRVRVQLDAGGLSAVEVGGPAGRSRPEPVRPAERLGPAEQSRPVEQPGPAEQPGPVEQPRPAEPARSPLQAVS